MLNHVDLKKGTRFIYNGQPFEVLDFNLNFKGRGSSVAQTKIKNIISGQVLSQNFKPADTLEEAEIEKIPLNFIYQFKGKYAFAKANDKSQRTELNENQIGESAVFLKPGQEVDGLVFNKKIVGIIMPIKVALKVKSAPPGIKGNRSESGVKQVELESGAVINVPLFIKQGDLIEVNTETKQYVRRI